MAVNYFEKKKKKQKSLIMIFILVILAVFFVLYFGYYKKNGQSSLTGQILTNNYSQEVNIDFHIFDNPVLKGLNPFEEISPFEGKKGRENPFLPY